MKLGARIFKTGLAIVLAIYAASWIGLNPPFFAAIAATFAIQPSISRTFQTMLDQLQANIIGAGTAIVMVLAFGHDPVIIGVTVMIIIAGILGLKLDASTIPIAVVTVIIIMGRPGDGNFILFASERFALIMLGILASFLVNMLFLPPKHETKLYQQIRDVTQDTIQWIRLLGRHETNRQTLRKDLSSLKDQTVSIENLYLLFKEERVYTKKARLTRDRRVVLFKQMIASMNKIVTILRTLDKFENNMQHAPSDMQEAIRNQLDHLMDYHDRILQRYVGKVTTHLTEEMAEEVDEGRVSLTDQLMEMYDQQNIDRSEWLHLLPIVAHIVEYNEQLEHLDRLVETYFRYHSNEDFFAIEN